ncbi:replication-relaxation family protein [Pyxidicoccus sp. MSG2]|uniref:replication-relaxation family protein n=1 Tax=Pyxidicoccus sp. MSG2 TaxID=2996790 RepID=UPI0022714E00|nr:replication-relaxation family protein [Pyxidicoccus sp. MSG2]MCY1024064.1 replication-relaxation family protein [Pyxidicoccus sp. MSG2]
MGAGDGGQVPAAVPLAPRRGRGRPRTRPPSPPRLQERDRHLLGLLAVARYLDADQIGRLCFPGRHRTRAGVRLWQLADESGGASWPPFVRSIEARFPDGTPRQAWALTDTGYRVAEDLLGLVKRPNRDTAPQFMAHALATTELLVQLLAAGLRSEPGLRGEASRSLPPMARVSDFAHADDPRYRWIASDSAQRPWSEYDQAKNVRHSRELRPDAILEVPAARVRLFVECEMGTQTVSPLVADAPGSTLNKLTRYASFLNEGADVDPLGVNRTFYDQSFADGFLPELLFLVQSAARERTVASAVEPALATWQQANPGRRPPVVRVAQVAGAVQHVQSLASAAPPRPSGPEPEALPRLSRNEIQLLVDFYGATQSAFKTLRDTARAQGATPPEYPARIAEVHKLLERLRR